MKVLRKIPNMVWLAVWCLMFALIGGLLPGCASKKKDLTPFPETLPMVIEEKAVVVEAVDFEVAPEKAVELAPMQEFSGKIKTIYFDYDRYYLRDDMLDALGGACALLSKVADQIISIEGHTCDIGTEEYNLSLGQARADAVEAYLLSCGILPWKIQSMSHGEFRPASDDLEKNRRVEIILSE